MHLTKLVRLRSVFEESETRPSWATRPQIAYESQSKLSSELVPKYRPFTELCGQDPARYPTTIDASIHVPNPGLDEEILYSNELLTIVRCVRVRIREIHCLPCAWSSKNIDQNLVEEFTLHRKSWYRIHIARNTRMLMSGATHYPVEFFAPGTHERFIKGGVYVVKLDSNNGGKTKTFSLSLPSVEANEYADLRPYIGYRLVASTGALHRMQTSFTEAPINKIAQSGRASHAQFTRRRFFDYIKRPCTEPIMYQKTTDSWTGSFRLPAGEYRLESQESKAEDTNKTLRLFPSGAVKALHGDELVTLSPRIDKSFRGSMNDASGTIIEVIFHPASNTVIRRDMDENSPIKAEVYRLTLGNRCG